MYFPLVSTDCSFQYSRIFCLCITKIKSGYLFHILIGQHKIPYIKVFYDTLFFYRLWNNSNTSLDIPADYYLADTLSIFFTNGF